MEPSPASAENPPPAAQGAESSPPAAAAATAAAARDDDVYGGAPPPPARSRARRRRRQHRHRRAEPARNREKPLLHFSTALIFLGSLCVCVQMLHFSNHSVMSDTQPGLWTGTFYIISGSVGLGLAKIYGLYSTLSLLSFCLVSLFLSLTLISLSWLGVLTAQSCEWKWYTECQSNSSDPDGSFERLVYDHQFDLNATNCNDLANGACGLNISFARYLHLLLFTFGLAGATISFTLGTLTCSRPPQRPAQYADQRLSVFALDASSSLPPSVRPITAWEFPPPVKNPLAPHPDDPPPAYEAVVIETAHL